MATPETQSLVRAISLIGFFVSYSLVAVLLESIIFGIYTLLVISAMAVIARSRNALTTKKAVLLCTCGVMYAAAVAHLGINLWCLFEDSRRSDVMQAMVVGYLSHMEDEVACSSLNIPGSYEEPVEDAFWVVVTLNVLLSMNMLLGDMVVLWRAWVLWPRRRIVQGISVLPVFATLAMLIWNCVWYDAFIGYVGSVAICISWFTNLWSTGLVAVRAWRHRRHMGPLLASGSRTRAGLALLLLIESGMLYCILWIPLVVSSFMCILEWSGLDHLPGGSGGRLLRGMIDVQVGCLIDLVGMYPTAVILLVQVSDGCAQKTLSINDMPTLVQQQSPTGPETHGESHEAWVAWTPERNHVEGSDRGNAKIQLTAYVRRSEA